MEIRKDLEPVAQYLQRLLTYGEVFHRNNIKEWPDLRYKQDFDKIYQLKLEDRKPLEEIYETGRDLAGHMSLRLESFNYAADYPTLTSYIESFSAGWLTEIDTLEKISEKANIKCSELGSHPWAIKMMIALFDKQIELLKNIRTTLDIMMSSDLYKIENGELGISTKIHNHCTNITTFSNISGKVNCQSNDNSVNIDNRRDSDATERSWVARHTGVLGQEFRGQYIHPYIIPPSCYLQHMARIARVICPGIPHHITQRGNRRQATFFCDDDYLAHIELLAEWCGKCGVTIWAWCLMPNHVHLIAVPQAETSLARALGEAHRGPSSLYPKNQFPGKLARPSLAGTVCLFPHG